MNEVSTYQPNNYLLRRNRQSRQSTTQDKIKAAAGSFVGVALPIAMMMKKQGVRNPHKLKYTLPDMIILSGTPILGGVTAGMIGNDKDTNIAKTKEGVFQFLNAAIPTWLTGASIRLCETSTRFNNIPAKIASITGSLLIGMHGAASVSNLICDPKDKYPDRKLDLKDSLANIDDMLGVFVLAKFPFADKIHLEKILPFIYSYCGYRAGKSN
ncbi:MAG: hypothetical protein NC408_09950 [Candidatus Gastranaerophilales bacterium]|nr:hypothetical protein [Candidatus Gastranaerophilales bacterium]